MKKLLKGNSVINFSGEKIIKNTHPNVKDSLYFGHRAVSVLQDSQD
jgi:hypothetical protein